MALKDRLQEEARTTLPLGFSCPHYDPVPGSKRCKSYLDGGACTRPDQLMCVEWLKANGQAAPVTESTPASPAPPADAPTRPHDAQVDVPRDLFGQPLPPRAALRPAAPPARSPSPAPEPLEPVLVRGLTDDDIASFKALGVEVCVASDAVGELWIVPEYSGSPRKEISVEHAATLVAICQAFPGAKVVRFDRSTGADAPEA